MRGEGGRGRSGRGCSEGYSRNVIHHRHQSMLGIATRAVSQFEVVELSATATVYVAPWHRPRSHVAQQASCQ